MQAPVARVGIVGAGQLGRMLALAGHPLGVECVLLDRDPQSPGGRVAPQRCAELDDAEALAALAREVDVVTLEIENAPGEALAAASQYAPVHPPIDAVTAAQDRLAEKELFTALGIPTAPFEAVDGPQDLEAAADRLGLPLVLKSRRLGYDGRGQRIVDSKSALRGSWSELGEVPAIAEQWVEFRRELSVIGARGDGGSRVVYPLAENTHSSGILATTLAPYPDRTLQRTAEGWLDALFERLGYRGVLTVELFDTGDGLLANEMAPRVHNSGHWTIEGAETSQFENHLRAVLGWPLGETAARGHAAMVNLLGRLPAVERVLAVPGAHLHVYGKAPRPGRKLGHCTLVDADRRRLLERLGDLRRVTGEHAP